MFKEFLGEETNLKRLPAHMSAPLLCSYSIHPQMTSIDHFLMILLVFLYIKTNQCECLLFLPMFIVVMSGQGPLGYLMFFYLNNVIPAPPFSPSASYLSGPCSELLLAGDLSCGLCCPVLCCGLTEPGVCIPRTLSRQFWKFFVLCEQSMGMELSQSSWASGLAGTLMCV